jgi:hypothetical protein
VTPTAIDAASAGFGSEGAALNAALNAALATALTASTGLLGGIGVCEGAEGGGAGTGRSGRNDPGGADEGAPIPDGAVTVAASLLVASRACF